MKKNIIFTAVTILLLLLISIALYMKVRSGRIEFSGTEKGMEFVRARVVRVTSEQLTPEPQMPGFFRGVQEIEVELLSGPQKGEVVAVTNNLSFFSNVRGRAGMNIVVTVDAYEDIRIVTLFSVFRLPAMLGLGGIFFLLLLVLGGKKGVKAILGLAFTLIYVVYIFVPMLAYGYSPIAASLLAVILTALLTLVVLNGVCTKTLCAAAGTILGTAAAGLACAAAGFFAHLTGYNMTEADALYVIAQETGIKLSGLLFAGIMIASLGAVMDVSLSIASAIEEIHFANPAMDAKALFLSGMNVGKDMMGTMSNTLILAFFGGSLNVALLIHAYGMPLLQLLNMDELCIQVVQSLAGSIGIVCTVPITAALSVFLTKRLQLFSPTNH